MSPLPENVRNTRITTSGITVFYKDGSTSYHCR